jgi:hypothetical protein
MTPHRPFFRKYLIPLDRWVVMAKPLLQLAALGVAGFALWKIASFFLFPLLMLAFKIALIIVLVMLAIWFFKKDDKSKGDASSPPTSSDAH